MPQISAAALQDFMLVATHGGFRTAGRIGGRSVATLSRHVGELERELGVRLIERSEKGVRLTLLGQRLLEGTKGPMAEIDEVVDAISSSDGVLRGRLRISAAVVFAHAHLIRIASGFAAANPEVEVEIVADDRLVDPVEEEFDIVIRANPAPDERLVGRLLVRTDRVAVAAPTVPIPISGDRALQLLLTTAPFANTLQLLAAGGKIEVGVRPGMRLSTLLMMREAALQGAGVALLPRTLVHHDLLTGSLSSWGVVDGPQTDVWVLHTSRRLPSPKVTSFVSFLDRALKDWRFANEDALGSVEDIA